MGNLRQKYTDEEWDEIGREIKREKQSKTIQHNGKTYDILEIDWKARLEEQEARKKQIQDNIKKEKKAEEDRIKEMKCPVCKSTSKEHIINSQNNGVMGSGYYSYITNEYYMCNKCGVHYSDLNKKTK